MTENCWILTDGKAGMLSQAVGLAEIAGLDVCLKTIHPHAFWGKIPAALWPPGIMGVHADSVPLLPPWPRLTISCGRHGVGPALEVKRRSGHETLSVHIQHPRVRSGLFDLIVAPKHDGLTGPNVVVTTGSVHSLTREKLDQAAVQWKSTIAHLPHPRIAVIIGGSNGAYLLNQTIIRQMAYDLKNLVKTWGGSLLITPSRRTGSKNINALQALFSDKEVPVHIWDMQGDNPYQGYLGLADFIIVTCDSVNMLSEATASTKPVYMYRLPKVGSHKKFTQFHDAMTKAGAIRIFDSTLKPWQPTMLDDTRRAAQKIKDMISVNKRIALGNMH